MSRSIRFCAPMVFDIGPTAVYRAKLAGSRKQWHKRKKYWETRQWRRAKPPIKNEVLKCCPHFTLIAPIMMKSRSQDEENAAQPPMSQVFDSTNESPALPLVPKPTITATKDDSRTLSTPQSDDIIYAWNANRVREKSSEEVLFEWPLTKETTLAGRQGRQRKPSSLLRSTNCFTNKASLIARIARFTSESLPMKSVFEKLKAFWLSIKQLSRLVSPIQRPKYCSVVHFSSYLYLSWVYSLLL